MPSLAPPEAILLGAPPHNSLTKGPRPRALTLTMSDGDTKPVVHEAHEVDTFHVPRAFYE